MLWKCPDSDNVKITFSFFPSAPHTRYTLQINYLARLLLISPSGVFTQFASSGGKAMITILKRSLSSMTYRSLCMSEDIAERGMEDVPNYYYRDDGLMLWDIIQRFVKGVLGHYYKSDAEVSQDSELQQWIQDIFEHGFLSQANMNPSKALIRGRVGQVCHHGDFHWTALGCELWTV
ncbi:arachidonate 15-lipoxygenase B-like isoform X1 [Gymnodraco acuticeps]|uniref:Arachidonate 15-lipoxygenase B-like isoform X1 n=1 Tax=Gymnodraco acuticeps TaxID=8218 RepID=A0A6P8V730_GYMAC|nr:arachidonate 15-lipoxygenase B-like isoform X1 [Gymnodraco acuticeps]